MLDDSITYHDANSEKGQEILKSVSDSLKESKSYVDSFGGKTYEGFIRTENGPVGIDNGD